MIGCIRIEWNRDTAPPNPRDPRATLQRPAWHTLRVDFDRPKAQKRGHPGYLIGINGADPVVALLELLGEHRVASPDERLAELIDARIRELDLPPVLAADPVIDPGALRYSGALRSDLLTVIALQSRSAGRLLVRDCATRLTAIQTRAGRFSRGRRRFQWAVKLYLQPDLVARISALHQPEWGRIR